jgi:hypothetical protein
MTERTLQDFVTSLQSGAISGMPHLANPAALASELFSGLRGYFEKERNLEKAFRSPQSRVAPGNGVEVALMSVPDEQRTTGLHGGPARENLGPDGDSGVSPVVRTDLAEVQRLMDLILASASFMNETELIATEVLQISHSVNTLLKGQ